MQEKIRTEVIVFDQGNTLVMDPFEEIIKFRINKFIDLFKKYSIRLDPNNFINAWTKANKTVNYPNISHFSQEEPIIQDALRRLDIFPEIAAFLGFELLLEYRIGYKELTESDPRTEEVRETLQILKNKGKRLGVFSNDRIIGLGMVMGWMRIKDFFEYVETSESIGIEKPDVRVFEHILRYFNQQPNLVTYVGDDPIRDIDASKRLGLKAILYSVDSDKYNESWRQYKGNNKYKPNLVIRNFSELTDLIE